MELKLESLENNGIPQDCFISVRVGDMQKLSRIAAVRNYRFPKSSNRFGKVDLFKRIGSCSINVDPDELGTREVFLDCTNSGYGSMKLAVDVGFKADSCAPQPQKSAEPGDDVSKANLSVKKVKQAHDYLNRHGIESLLSNSMHELLREQPDDPAEFLASKLLSGAGGSKSIIKCPPINHTPNFTDEKPMPEPKVPKAQRPSSRPKVHRPSSRPGKLTPLSNAPTSPTSTKVFNKSPSMFPCTEKKKKPQAAPPPEEKEVPPVDREPREGNGTSDDTELAKQAACAALISVGPGEEVNEAALEDMKAEAFGALSNLLLNTTNLDTGRDELEDAKEEAWNSLMKALSADIPRAVQLEDLKEEAHQALMNVLGDGHLSAIEDAKQGAWAALNTVLNSDTGCTDGVTLDHMKGKAYQSLSNVMLSASNVAMTDELFQSARAQAFDALTKVLRSDSANSHRYDDVETMKESAWQALNSALSVSLPFDAVTKALGADGVHSDDSYDMETMKKSAWQALNSALSVSSPVGVTDAGIESVKIEAHQALTNVLAGAIDRDSPLLEAAKQEAWTSLRSVLTCPEIPAHELGLVKMEAHAALTQALCSEVNLVISKDMEEAAGMALQALNDHLIDKTPSPKGKKVIQDLYPNMVTSGTK